jgi:hypothetical protein
MESVVSVYKDIQGLCQAQVQVVVDVVFMFAIHLAIQVGGMISSQKAATFMEVLVQRNLMK